MTPPTANVVTGLAASLWEEIGMIPDLEQLIPAPHAPAGLSEPPEFNRTRKIKKIASADDVTEKTGWMLC